MSKQKVIVGLSGGVDSSVAAYLLKEQGYDVAGVTMQVLEDDGVSKTAVEDAGCVAKMLDIPQYVMDFREIFQTHVVDNFISEYIAGNTPNPCIRCNRYVKWEALLARGREFGADYIATGHYARIGKSENGRFTLCKSVTETKDQTYALYRLTQEQLAHTLMPLGDYGKEEIRQIAVKAGLPVAEKPDSQEICFIPDNDYAGFLDRHADAGMGNRIPPAGNFVDKEGNVLGQHAGIHRYTIGQRKGLNIAFGEPMYVCEIRPDTDEVVLGRNEDTFTEELFCTDINYMAADHFEDGQEAMAKIRYGSKEYLCKLNRVAEDVFRCYFPEKIRAATPGQSIVFYRGEEVLGGGTIIRKMLN